MVSLRDHLKKAAKAQHEKYTKEDFSKWGKRSAAARTKNMTPEEKKDYFRRIRAGKKVSNILK